MKLYANPTITDFRQDVNGDIKMLKIGVNKEDAYANIIAQAEGASSDYNFYSWKDEDEKLWYTLTPTPQANDYAYPQYGTITGTIVISGIGTIVSVTDTTITFVKDGEETYTATRDNVTDLTFLKSHTN